MPELPEVETIKRDLEKLLVRKVIGRIEISDPAILTGISAKVKSRRNITVQQFKEKIVGKQIHKFNRRGKYLIMEFSDGSSLIFHLRMTGQLIVQSTSGNERAIFFMNSGQTLSFVDRRRFGEIFYSADWKKEPAINLLGVEPLNGKMTADFLKESFSNRTASVHSLLLNQKIVCGIGNIYANEALFQADIRPQRMAQKVSLAELKKLVSSIQDVLKQSILHRGYSMSTYVDAMGKKGRNQLFTVVYGKEGLPCSSCGKSLLRKVIAGRSAVYCSNCQK